MCFHEKIKIIAIAIYPKWVVETKYAYMYVSKIKYYSKIEYRNPIKSGSQNVVRSKFFFKIFFRKLNFSRNYENTVH